MTRLNLRGEMMISPAPIAQVADLQSEILAQLWTSALGSVFLDLVLDLSGIHQVKLQVRNIKNISKLVVTALLFLSSFSLPFPSLASLLLPSPFPHLVFTTPSLLIPLTRSDEWEQRA